MATFDQLSAEQRAIIELVVQRGRSYEALADVLQIETSRVRELARDALTSLSPVTAGRVDQQWRGQVADYLLGQQSGPESTATRGHLKRSEPARTWAMSLLDSLDNLYANGSRPTIPEAEDGAPRRRRGGGAAVATAPVREPEPKPKPARERERERKPLRKPVERKPLREEAPPRGELSPEAQSIVRRRRIIGGVVAGLIGIGVILGILAIAGAFGGGSSKAKPKTATNASATQTKIVGQIPLKPINGASATGTAYILERGGQRVLVVQAKLPPLPNNQRKAAYEVWLFNSQKDASSIGAQFTDAQGNYQGAGPLPANFAHFKFVDISREPFNTDTGHSGDSVLRGAFADLAPVPQNQQPSTGTGATPGTGVTPGAGTGTTP